MDRDSPRRKRRRDASRGGGDASAFEADVLREAEVKAAIEAGKTRYGSIDILHNNVGASLALGDATATDLEEEAFDRIVAVNLRGMWFACKHAIPVMRDQGSGSIVNISSMAVRSAYPYLGYKTTKRLSLRWRKPCQRERALRHPREHDPPGPHEHADGDRTSCGRRHIPRRSHRGPGPPGAARAQDGDWLGHRLCLALPAFG